MYRRRSRRHPSHDNNISTEQLHRILTRNISRHTKYVRLTKLLSNVNLQPKTSSHLFNRGARHRHARHLPITRTNQHGRKHSHLHNYNMDAIASQRINRQALPPSKSQLRRPSNHRHNSSSPKHNTRRTLRPTPNRSTRSSGIKQLMNK